MDSHSIAHLESLLRIQAQQITDLLRLNAQQAEMIESLRAEIVELKRRLGQNSGNSSMPPSSDRFKAVSKEGKVKGKGGPKRKRGGQPGHKGHNLPFAPADAVATVERHLPCSCSECGQAFSSGALQAACVGEVRQVHDLPPIKLQITEHQQMVVACPCGHVQKGAFPIEVAPGVSYGVGVQALCALLYTRHSVSLERIGELLEDFCGAKISAGAVLGSVRRSAGALQPHIDQIVAALQQSPVLHLDETKADPWWIHVISTRWVTLLQAHESRGKVAHEAFEARIGEFYQTYRGHMVHDSLALYHMYEQAQHALCGAHLLRELNGLIEQGSKWGQQMHDWFMALYRQCDYGQGVVPQDPALGQAGIWGRLRKEYFAILRKADKEEPAAAKGAKGRAKATKGRNLMIRLREHAAAVFAFALHLEVSFTNNQAERDLRPVKLKAKVSGCFRNPTFAQHWATIQSCISTARKQGINPYEMIREALRGQHLTLC